MNYNTAFCLVCSVRTVQVGAYGARPLQDSRPRQTSPNRSVDGGRLGSKGSGGRVSTRGYTSTPLMRDPSKTMVKSWMVCRMRMSELTVMRSRRRALSSYIRVMAGHSANSGIHWGSRRSLQARTETALSVAASWQSSPCRSSHWEGVGPGGTSSQAPGSAERELRSRSWIFTGGKAAGARQCRLTGRPIRV